MAFTAGLPLLRTAVVSMSGPGKKLVAGGKFLPLDPDWGAAWPATPWFPRGCATLSAYFMRRIIPDADGAEAAWWLGMMRNGHRKRPLRALRILVEAVK